MIESRLLHHVGIIQPSEEDAQALMSLLGHANWWSPAAGRRAACP